MPNAATHRIGAALAIGGISAYAEKKNGENSPKPITHAVLAAVLGTIPDCIEPALHPNHRQFFHSIAFAGLLGIGLYKLHQWETEDKIHQFIKTIGLIAGGAYLVHLAMDATTTKSLPII
jgi:membrane-bound metal-dependent hydrolase YbcI (DUF457 family)